MWYTADSMTLRIGDRVEYVDADGNRVPGRISRVDPDGSGRPMVLLEDGRHIAVISRKLVRIARERAS